MKIHTDFITNSSSSSYLIMLKENLDKQELKRVLMEAIGLSSTEKGIFPTLGEEIADVLIRNVDSMRIDEYVENYTGVNKISDLKNMGIMGSAVYENFVEYPYIKAGFVADDSDEPIEVMLVDETIKFKNDKIVIVKNGGY